MDAFYNAIRKELTMIKGDTLAFNFQIQGLGGIEPTALYFTCRENLNDNSEILFSSTLGDGISLVDYDEENDIRKYAIRVIPSKTENLQSGTYYYDEEIRVNGDVFTIMKGKFILEQDSSRGGN